MCDTEQIKSWFRPPYGGTLFKAKDWVYVTDINSANYNGVPVMFDTQTSTNVDMYLLWSEGYIVMPMQILATTANTAHGQHPLVVGWKNGWWHCIDRIQLQINDATCTNALPMANVIAHLRVLTSFTPEAAKLVGCHYNFCLDTCDSYEAVNAAAIAAGAAPQLGTNYYTRYYNNLVVDASPVLLQGWSGTASGGITLTVTAPAAGVSALSASLQATDITYLAAGRGSLPLPGATTLVSSKRSPINEGLKQRCLWQNRLTNVANTGVATDMGGQLAYAKSSNLLSDYAINTVAGSGSTGNIIANYYVTLPLKILHDVFNQMTMPLKRIRVRLNLYPNYVTTSQTSVAAVCTSRANYRTSGNATLPEIAGGFLTDATNPDPATLAFTRPAAQTVTITSTKVPQFAGQTNPLMTTNVSGAMLAFGNANDTGRFTGANYQGSIQGLTLQMGQGPCRIYVPVVEPFKYQLEKVLPWSRHIPFWDHQIYTQTLFGNTNGQFDWIITPGLANARRVWLIPRPSTSASAGVSTIQGSANSTAAVDGLCVTSGSSLTAWQRAECTEPGSASYGCYLQNLQLFFGPNTVYRNPIQYSYEYFMNQFLDCIPNAGQDRVIAPGLIDKYMFETSYGFFCFNLTRQARTWMLQEAPLIKLSAANISQVPIDLIAIIEYERIITIGMIDKTGASVAG